MESQGTCREPIPLDLIDIELSAAGNSDTSSLKHFVRSANRMKAHQDERDKKMEKEKAQLEGKRTRWKWFGSLKGNSEHRTLNIGSNVTPPASDSSHEDDVYSSHSGSVTMSQIRAFAIASCSKGSFRRNHPNEEIIWTEVTHAHAIANREVFVFIIIFIFFHLFACFHIGLSFVIAYTHTRYTCTCFDDAHGRICGVRQVA